MEERFDFFEEKFYDLGSSCRIALYNEYCRECDIDNEIFDFDEEFFSMFFTNPYDSARATACGNVVWCDEYIKFDGYGNLESLSTSQAASYAADNIRDIYDWGGFNDYIDMSEFDDKEDEEEDDEMKIEGDL